MACGVADLASTCQAPDSSPWGRWLATTRGSAAGAGHLTDDLGLWLDDQYVNEGNTETTQEYGHSALKVGTTPPDDEGKQYTLWQDTPVLKTDQSFTLSAWVVLDSLDAMQTAVSVNGVHDSAARLRFNPDSGKWQFVVSYQDTVPTALVTVSSTSSAEAGAWTHLVAVYDSGSSRIRIYINGVLEGTATVSSIPFASSGPLMVGRTLWQNSLVDQWTGGIDEVRVFQGAMSDAAVNVLYESQTD